METRPSLPALPGETLAGTYRVERVLGEGGMGVVVLARHLRLEQRVAIKMLRPEAIRELGLARFLKEGKILAQLKGPHTARVIDVGDVDGAPYLVMEYLEGRTLARVLSDEGPFEVERAVDSVLEVCEALAEVHRAGIVHRDVKLSNLMLEQTPSGRPSIKLFDFGISKALGTETLTQSAALVGSPRYMAPEQLESARDVDARADVWALGVVLFELLTDRRPFAAETLPQLCVAIRETPPLDLAELRPELPPGLVRIVARCLAKPREARYGSVGALAAELSAFASARGREAAEAAARLAIDMETTLEAPSTSVPGDSSHFGGTELPVNRPARPDFRGVAVVLAVGGLAAGLWFTLGRRPPPEPAPEVVVAASPARVPDNPPPPAPAPSAVASSALAAPPLAAPPHARPASPQKKAPRPAPGKRGLPPVPEDR